MTRDIENEIYNWYKRSGNITLVADLFGVPRDVAIRTIRVKQAYYSKRLLEIRNQTKTYTLDGRDTSLAEDEKIVKDTEKKIEKLTEAIIKEYHKKQNKEVVKVETKRKTARVVKKADKVSTSQASSDLDLELLNIKTQNKFLSDSISTFKKQIKGKDTVDIKTIDAFLKELGTLKKMQTTFVKELENK